MTLSLLWDTITLKDLHRPSAVVFVYAYMRLGAPTALSPAHHHLIPSPHIYIAALPADGPQRQQALGDLSAFASRCTMYAYGIASVISDSVSMKAVDLSVAGVKLNYIVPAAQKPYRVRAI